MAQERERSRVRVQGMPLVGVAAAVLIIAVLYLAQQVLIPIALAVLLSFLLTPVVKRLEKWGLPRVPSVLLVAALSFAAIGGVGYLVTYQVYSLAEQLPQYRQNITQRLQSLRGTGGGAIGKAADVLEEAQEEVEQEVKKQEQMEEQEERREEQQERAEQRAAPTRPPLRSQPPSTAPPPEGAQPPPIPVRVVEEVSTPFQYVRDYLGAILSPLAMAGIVVVFVIFFLIQRDDLRDRLIRLAGSTRLELTTRTLNDSAKRISRYLLMQLVINVSYGVPVGIGLWLIGVPGALLWGLMATLLRFIPFVGPWIAASMPILLSLAVFDGWGRPLAVAGLYVALELFSNNVLETWLYGSSTGMSPIAVLLAAVFWSWLWGPVGLLLAVPLTACLVVLGRHVSQVSFFTILLGNEPALTPAERFYQRLLALDEDEALDLAEEHRDEHGLVALYDDVIIPALHLEERDRHAGRLAPDRQEMVRASVREIVEELGEWRPPEAGDEVSPPPPVESAERGDEGPKRTVLCLPARDEADELAARIFAQVLIAGGIDAEPVSVGSLSGETVERVRAADARLVCISAVPPAAGAHARYLCKRLKRQMPELRILVGLWNVAGSFERTEQRLIATGAAHVATNFQAALDRVRKETG